MSEGNRPQRSRFLQDYRLLRDQMEWAYPSLWRRAYPRHYVNVPGNYASPKSVAWAILDVDLRIKSGYGGDAVNVEAVWAHELLKYRVPLYWGSLPLVQAVQQTQPRISFDATGHLPLPCAAIMLPRGALAHPSGGDVVFVSWARIQASATADLPSSGAFMVIASVTDPELGTPQIYHWNIPLHKFPTVDMSNVIALTQGSPALTAVTPPGLPACDASLDGEDKVFLAHIITLTLGLIQLMMVRPHFVERGVLQKRLAPHDGASPPCEFWSPNMLGRTYCIKKIDGALPQGHHASPRGHWVRGFFRDQACGPHHQDHHEMWIEPFWRGGEI